MRPPEERMSGIGIEFIGFSQNVAISWADPPSSLDRTALQLGILNPLLPRTVMDKD